MKTPDELKAEILRLTREYARRVHRAQRPGVEDPVEFVPGETVVPYAGRVFTEDEVEAGVGSMLDFWLTLGKEGEEFERQLASRLWVRSFRRSRRLGFRSSMRCRTSKELEAHSLSALREATTSTLSRRGTRQQDTI